MNKDQFLQIINHPIVVAIVFYLIGYGVGKK